MGRIFGQKKGALNQGSLRVLSESLLEMERKSTERLCHLSDGTRSDSGDAEIRRLENVAAIAEPQANASRNRKIRTRAVDEIWSRECAA